MTDWIQLTTADDPIEAGFLHGLLESAGIEVQLRGMELWGVAVEIYYSEGARPSLWVRRRDVQSARRVLARRDEAGDGLPWTCPDCGERLEGQFTTCWQCGHAREAAG
ncbi:putative signal transducing protein [Wenzhouxiangella sp. EGI_FJ10409]|uniref:putative signal transducing protein n=1 Tax=Wenzhouxiangella sp. EGI_FJ10409 TaxID=3243767 RepID=UPI0035E09E43